MLWEQQVSSRWRTCLFNLWKNSWLNFFTQELVRFPLLPYLLLREIPEALSKMTIQQVNQTGLSEPWLCVPPYAISSVQFSSVQLLSRVRLFETPWNAAHQSSLSITNSRSLLKLNVHRVSDAIQPSNPLSSPSLPAFNRSQHQGFFKWISSSHQVTKVLELQLQHQSFQWIIRTDFF